MVENGRIIFGLCYSELELGSSPGRKMVVRAPGLGYAVVARFCVRVEDDPERS